MDKRSAQIATISECVDHCFAYDVWCEDFATTLDPEDIVEGLDRGAEVVANATRLVSFLALRKLDDFLRKTKAKPDDLVASDFGIDETAVLGGGTLLTAGEREKINKEAAHLTERLALDADSEVDLEAVLARSRPVFERLVAELRKADTAQEAAQWLAKTKALIDRS